ncbi:MAG TPA: response regulator transcription factor [Sphingomicrobium sp.]|nr:response regulator transcription factor [Sphingomicrobium sp.]
MARTLLYYSTALAAAAAALQWVEYRYLAHAFSFQIYLALVAVAFLALGAWAARRLTPRPAPAAFEINRAAIRSLALTKRECEILERLASGQSNKELARALDISPNTVKTHLASLYAKLEVRNRIEAIEKARSLALIA